jgi:hypothetical protein
VGTPLWLWRMVTRSPRHEDEYDTFGSFHE